MHLNQKVVKLSEIDLWTPSGPVVEIAQTQIVVTIPIGQNPRLLEAGGCFWDYYLSC